MAAPDDIAVLARWRQSRDNWTEVTAVFAFHYRSLVEACVGFTCDRDRAARRYDGDAGGELYQETALRLLHQLWTAPPDIHTSFHAYFVQAAHNIWTNRQKRSRRKQPLDQRIQSLAAPDHADRLEEQEDRAKLTEGLNALDERTRHAVTLRHGENLPLREVADQMNLSVSGAKKRSDKGLARLRAVFRRR